MLARHRKVFTVIASLALLFSASAGADTEEPGVSDTLLSHAVEALEKATGGKVLEVRLIDEQGEPSFEAVVAKDDDVLHLRISSVNDAISVIEVKDLPQWAVNWELTAYARSIKEAKVPLAQAILMAEGIAGAPAIGAGLAKPLDGTNAVLAYTIEHLKGGKHTRVVIDAQTGLKIADPEELYEPWTPIRLVHRTAP